jgi:uncharacterized UBP type Zn finger protein
MGESRNILRVEEGDLVLCEECPACGADGVLLRICASCGHVGCAEGSPGDHAFEHCAETDHPIAAAIGSVGMSWWSYPDGRTVPPRR